MCQRHLIHKIHFLRDCHVLTTSLQGLSSFGLELGLRLNEDSDLSFVSINGSQDYLEEASQFDSRFVFTRADLSIEQHKILFRQKLGSSSYLGMGFGERKVRVNFGGIYGYQNAYTTRLTSESSLAHFLIGNSWAFGPFGFIAIDWVDFGIPIGKPISQAPTSIVHDRSGNTQVIELSSSLNDDLTQVKLHTYMNLRIGFYF